MNLQGAFFLQCYLMMAAAMYFQLGEQEEKCIIEEIPVDTLVSGESCIEGICQRKLDSNPSITG